MRIQSPGAPGSVKETAAGIRRSRLAGLALTLIAVGPPLVVVTGLVLAVITITGLIGQVATDVTAVAAVVDGRISPQIAKVEQAFERLGAPLAQLQSQIEGALSAVEQVGSVRIAAGQWGRTPSVHITIPPKDLPIASVPEAEAKGPFGGIVNAFDKAADKVVDSVGSIKAGEVFNQATPSVAIPPAPIVLPMEPVQQALAPLGPNGVVGKAIKGVESEVGAAIADVRKLQQPILAIRDGIAGLLAPLQAAVGPLVSALVVVAVAFVAQVLVWGVGLTLLLLTHPAEFVHALLTRGPIGLLGYSSRALLLRGFSNAFARTPSPPQEHALDALRERASRLQTEMAALRANIATAP